MSQTGLQEFSNARKAQLQQNEARNMRKHVQQARGDVPRSASRWPFELTQNAHDPGARTGQTEVNLTVSFDGTSLVYEHDGKPFSAQELAALLSGGSSKEFEAIDTTGRFGTGFLLTHVLSPQVNFEGIFATAGGHEKVSLTLDRSGDEDTIYANTLACEEGINQAVPIKELKNHKTARFDYKTDNPEAARIGISALETTLLYLYGTCEHLGEATLNQENRTIQFKPEAPTERFFEGFHVRERQIAVTENGTLQATAKAVRLRSKPDSLVSLVAVIKESNQQWRFVEPAPTSPRLFCRFPIRLSDFLPINAIIDGRFDLPQERDAILMEARDKEQIAEALSLLPSLVKLGLEDLWLGAHKLAFVGMPEKAFGEEIEASLKSWWREQLAATARKLAEMPIVAAPDGHLCKPISAATDQFPTCFVLPRFDTNQPKDEIDYAATWSVACELKSVTLPALDIAQDWTAIAAQWLTLSIPVNRLTLLDIAARARKGATTLAQLQTMATPLDWLARFLNLVGQVASQRNCNEALTGLLPDQNNTLKSPSSLKRDAGIDDRLKDISFAINLDVRSRLLSHDLVKSAAQLGFGSLKSLIEANIQETIDNAAVINECLAELSTQLPDTKPVLPAKQHFVESSIDLLKFLSELKTPNPATLAPKCPLIALDRTAVRWAPQRKAIAPVSMWHDDAQPFAGIYKEDRILAEDYVLRFKGDATLVKALVAWDMAFADPLTTDSPKDLRGDRLKAIAAPGTDCEGIVVSDLLCSQLALLPTELIQRSQTDEAFAKMLLGLALAYAARADTGWREPKPAIGRRNKDAAPLTLTPALWIADLRTKAWVPAKGELGIEHVLADSGNLKKLLDPNWLKDNDPGIKLLTTFFGFDELELRLLATAPNEEARKQLESGLAKLVQIVGSDPADYTKLTTAYEVYRQRQKEKERNRKFGLAVQAAIQQYLKDNQIHAQLIDCGYDYDVYVDVPSLDAGSHEFKLADYMLEVKATTTGEVRLTPAQAVKASDDPDHFVLCVVDLRGITHQEMEADWSAAQVEPKTKIVVGIGLLANQTRELVTQAKDSQVGIRNDGALRYGVPTDIWQTGLPIAEWVQHLKPLQVATGGGQTITQATTAGISRQLNDAP